MGQNTKQAQNKAKPRKVRGVMGLAAQTRQDNLNKALGDTGSGKVKRKKFGGKLDGKPKPKPALKGNKKK